LFYGHSKFKLGENESACQDWTIAAVVGSEEAGKILKKHCKYDMIKTSSSSS